jgi:hypothetical protein
MTKLFLRIVSKVKFLIPLYLIVFHCSLPVDPAEFAPQNLSYDKKIYFLYIGDELKAVPSVEYAVDSFTIDPSLPSGLDLDKSTGAISGKSDSALPLKPFTVQAFNKNGSTQCVLNIEISPFPSFVVQPEDVYAKVNGSVTLTAAATGKSPLKYSWLKNGATIDGEDSSILIISSISFSDTGIYRCKVVDSTGKTELSDPARCQIIDTGVVTTTDTIPPVIIRVKPENDSVSTNLTSYTIKIICTDSSGVLSVNGTLGSLLFTGTRGAANDWTIPITGLTADMFATVIVTASDSSLRTNQSTLNYYIKYDPTMDDLDGPMIKQVGDPVSGSVVSDPLVIIVDSVYDPSLIDSVYWTLNGGAAQPMVEVTGKPGQYSLTVSLTKEGENIFLITAADKSTQHNQSTQTIKLQYIIAPKVTVQPISKKMCPGAEATATVSVTATGTPPLHYQWSNAGTDIPNATDASYTLSSLSATKILTCLVSNGAATHATSNPCTLTVNPGVSITSHPNDTTKTCTGIETTISVTAQGGTGLQYQWYMGTSKVTGTDYKGATEAILTVPGMIAAQGKYHCVVTNSDGCSATSNEGVFALNNEVAVAVAPDSVSTCPGVNVTFNAMPTGGFSHTYKWYKGTLGSGEEIPGATSATYATSVASTYYCTATSSAGCVGTSNAVTLTTKTVSEDPTAAEASSTSITSGTEVTLSVKDGSLGTGASWKWYTGDSCSGTSFKSGDSIVVIPTTTTTYSVHGEGGCTNTICRSVTVTVLNPPSVAPTLVSPGNDSNGVPIAITASWGQVTGATGYTLQIANNSTFTSPVVNVSKTGETSTSHAVTELSNSSRYYWRVCATNEGGSGPWAVDSFTTILTWTVKNDGLTNFLINGIVVTSNGNVFVGTGGGVFLSTNAGDLWSAVNTGLTDKNVSQLISHGTTLFAATDSGLFRSTNSGGQWSLIVAPDVMPIGMIRSNGTTIFNATVNDGVYYSSDNGTTWVSPPAGDQLNGLLSNFLVDGSSLYAGASDGSIYVSNNNGGDWKLYAYQVVSHLLAIAKVNSVFYAADMGNGIYTSQDNGNTWVNIPSSPTKCYNIISNGKKMIALSVYGAVFSQEGGQNWVQTVPTINNSSSAAIGGGYIYVGTNGDGVSRSPLP